MWQLLPRLLFAVLLSVSQLTVLLLLCFLWLLRVLKYCGVLDQRYNKEIRNFVHFFQVDLLRLRCEGQPSTENFESIVARLEQADQLTQETLDDMLCRTPTGKRRPVIEERKTSRRTLRLLQSSLLTE